jgi:hypothetical protein
MLAHIRLPVPKLKRMNVMSKQIKMNWPYDIQPHIGCPLRMNGNTIGHIVVINGNEVIIDLIDDEEVTRNGE